MTEQEKDQIKSSLDLVETELKKLRELLKSEVQDLRLPTTPSSGDYYSENRAPTPHEIASRFGK